MNKKPAFDPAVPHRFFKAMVLMGGSIAVGCGGGLATDKTGSQDEQQPGGGNDASAATTGAASTSGGAGGSSTIGGSTTAGTTGRILIGTTGTTGSVHNDLPCPTQQWVCATSCTTQWPPSSACMCDEQRPLSASDCNPDTEALVCHEAKYDTNGNLLATSIPFSCACIPRAPSCAEACRSAFPTEGSGTYRCEEPDASDFGAWLCGCAIVYLR